MQTCTNVGCVRRATNLLEHRLEYLLRIAVAESVTHIVTEQVTLHIKRLHGEFTPVLAHCPILSSSTKARALPSGSSGPLKTVTYSVYTCAISGRFQM